MPKNREGLSQAQDFKKVQHWEFNLQWKIVHQEDKQEDCPRSNIKMKMQTQVQDQNGFQRLSTYITSTRPKPRYQDFK